MYYLELDSLDYIVVADSTGLAATSLTYSYSFQM